MKLKNIFYLLTFFISACSSTQEPYYDRGNWWYNDYYSYWAGYPRNCCYSEKEWEQIIKGWWSSLDENKQKEIIKRINNKYPGDEELNSTAPISALKSSLNNHWQSLPIEKRQTITNKRNKYMEKHQPSATNKYKESRYKGGFKTERPVIIRPRRRR